MMLKIDGRLVEATPGKSLRQMVKELGMDRTALSERPLAARIAGEVFTLEYIPVRNTQETARAAISAAQGQVSLIRYADPAGKDCYFRTAQFVLFYALYRLWPNARAKMSCTLGSALYIQVEGASDFSAEQLRNEVIQIVNEDIPLLRRRLPIAQAQAHFQNQGDQDKADLLRWWQEDYFDAYVYGQFWDHYYGELCPATGYLSVWEIRPAEGGFLFLFPDDLAPDRVGKYNHMPQLFSVFTEGERWCGLMECQTVAELNTLVEQGNLRQLIRVNEALHEKRFAQVADMVCQRDARVVMLAGPSSSGKTTSANRLATQLRVHGKKPILMSLDDYYIDREFLLPGPDGKMDYEHINTIDTELFRKQIGQLLQGERVELPSFHFQSGRRLWSGKQLRMEGESVIIVEGLHGLNPLLWPEGIADHLIFKLYVSPLLPLNLDDHNRIPTSYLRLLRRIVRDYETRGASVQHTLGMWDSVRRGEKRWIFPFQEQADVIFNSSTLYELAVLKKHIYPLLKAVGPEDDWFEEVASLVQVLDLVVEADVDDEIPPTSLVREFIGGNTFYR